MAQRLNKKLVVGLTVMGMLVITGAGVLLVINLPGRDPRPAAEQAEKLAEAKDYETASKYYAKAYTRAMQAGDTAAASDYMVKAGEMALLAGEQNAAVDCWARVLRNNPRHEEAQERIVAVRVEQAELYGGNWWDEVRSQAEILVAEDFAPQNVVGLNGLGRALVEGSAVSLADMKQGGEYLEKAFQQDNTNSKFASDLATYYIRVLEREIRDARQEGRTEQAAQLEGQREQAIQQAANVYDTLMQNILASPDPNPAVVTDAYRRRAQFHMFVRETGQIELQQKMQRRASQAELERIRNRIDTHSVKARECLETALEKTPEDVESLVLMGIYWRKTAPKSTDQVESQREADAYYLKAKNLYERAIEADPDSFDAYVELQTVYMRDAAAAFNQRDAEGLKESIAKASQVLEERIKRGIARTGIHQWRNRSYMAMIRWRLFQINSWQVDRLRQLAGNPEKAKAECQPILAKLRRIRADYVAEASRGEKDPRAMFMRGRVEMLDDKHGDAIRAFRELEDLLEPGDLWVQTKTHLAQLYMLINQPGEAVRYLEELVRHSPNRDASLGLLAQALSALPDREAEAEDAAKRALAINPNNTEALNALARIYEKQKNWRELERLHASVKSARQESETELLEATLLLARGSDPDHRDVELIHQGQAKLRKILEAEPSNLQALRAMVSSLAQMPEKRDEIDELLARATHDIDQKLQAATADGDKDAIKQLQTTRNGIAYLGVLADPNTTPEDRIAKTEAIIRQNSDPFLVAFDLYRLYLSSPDHQVQAVQQLKEAYRLKPDDPAVVELLFRTSISAIKDADGNEVMKPDWDLAERLVKRAVELGIDRSNGHFFQGQLLFARTDLPDNYAQAEQSFREALRLFPVHSNGHAWLGRTLLAQNRIEEARAAYEQALAENPRNAMAAYFLARIAQRTGDAEAKAKYLDICKELNAVDDWVREQLQLAADEADPQAGIVRREEIRQSDPRNRDNLIALARLYNRAGQRDQAKTVLEECYALDPKDLAFLQVYAEFLRGLNPPEIEKAEALIRQTLESFGPDEKAKAATAQLLLAAHMETLARRGAPEAPPAQAIEEAFIKAAEISDHAAVLSDIAAHYERTANAAKYEEWTRKAIARAQADDDRNTEIKSRRALVEFLLNMRDYKRAADIQKEIEAYRGRFDDSFALLAMSEYATFMGRETEAIEFATQYINATSGGEKALGFFRRGSMNYRRGNWDLAISDLRDAKALQSSGFNFEHRILLARCLQITGQTDQAIAELASILQEDRRALRAAEELYRVYLAAQRYDDAEAFIMPAYQTDPKSPRWIGMLTEIAILRGDQARAIERAIETVQNSEFSPPMVDNLLAAYLRFNQNDELLQYVATRLPEAARNDPRVLFRVATAYLAKGQTEQAREAFGKALAGIGEVGPQSLNIVVGPPQAVHMLSTVGLDTASEFVSEESARRPDNPYAKLAMAYMLRAKGDEEGLTTNLLQILENLPQDERQALALRIEVLQSLADSYHRTKQLEAARKTYEQILEIAPAQTPARIVALNNLAYLLVEHFNEPAAAVRYSEEAARLVPDQTNILDTFGWNLVQIGEYDRGVAALRAAIYAASAQDLVQLASVHYHAAYALHQRARQSRERGQGTRAEQDLAEAKLDCRRAHDLLFAGRSEGDGTLAKVVELGKELGLTLQAELPAPAPAIQ